MMQQCHIPGNSHRCHVSGRKLQPGEEYYSAVIETVTGLIRRDYATEHWNGPPEEAIAFWSGRLSEDEGPVKPKPLSAEEMLELFDGFAESQEPRQQQLRYVLTLLLLRKKGLKLKDIERQDSEEFLLVHRPREKTCYRVLDPKLSVDRIHEVEEELGALLTSALER